MSAVLLTFNPAVPARQNIVFAAGEDVTVTATYTPAPASALPGGATFTLVVYLEGEAILTKTGTVADAINGVVTFAIVRANTLSLSPGACTFVVSRTDSGYCTQGAVGQLNLLPGE